MSDYRVGQQKLVKELKGLIDRKVTFNHFSAEVYQDEGGWNWHVVDDKRYRGSLWFQVCEPGADKDHCFFASIGIYDVKLLADGATIVVRNTNSHEVVKTYILSSTDIGIPAELRDCLDELLRNAFWKHGTKVGQALRLPKGRSPLLRRTRRVERRRLKAVCRRK
jgi:hypothetical protein